MKKAPARRPRARRAPARDPEADRIWAQGVEHSADLIAMTDLDGRFVRVNRAFLDVLGRRKDEVIGQHFSIVLAGDNPAAVIQDMAEKHLTDRGWMGECVFACSDDTPLPLLLRVGPVKDQNGTTIAGFGIGRDIRDRRQVEAALRESEEQFRLLTENLEEVLYTLLPDPPRVVYISPAYEQIWGRSRRTLYERPMEWLDAVHPDDRARIADDYVQCLLGVPADSEFRIVRPDGAVRWIRGRSLPVYDDLGHLSRVVGIVADVTSRHEKETALRQAHARLDAALQEAERLSRNAVRLSELVDILQSCTDVDEAYRIAGSCLPGVLDAEAGALSITSPSRDILRAEVTWGATVGTTDTFAPDQCWALRRGTTHVVSDPDSPLRCAHMTGLRRAYLCVPLAAQGDTLGVLSLEGPAGPADDPIELSLRRLSDQAVVVGERISLALANLRLREVLKRQSIRDPLTGLFNRRYMEESLTRELLRAARDGKEVAVLMLDIDHFKQFNDTSGHNAGDTLLRAFGALLLERTRGEDIACRFGGEEFVVILSGTGLDDAARRAEVLRESASQLVVPHAGQVLGKVTVSIGIAASPLHGTTPEILIDVADRALYQAKEQGRNRVIIGASTSR